MVLSAPDIVISKSADEQLHHFRINNGDMTQYSNVETCTSRTRRRKRTISKETSVFSAVKTPLIASMIDGGAAIVTTSRLKASKKKPESVPGDITSSQRPNNKGQNTQESR